MTDYRRKTIQERAARYDHVLAFIKQFKAENDGNSPTIREICDGCDISSTSVCNYILGILDRAGKISLTRDGAARRISVTGGRWTYQGEA